MGVPEHGAAERALFFIRKAADFIPADEAVRNFRAADRSNVSQRRMGEGWTVVSSPPNLGPQPLYCAG